MKKQKNVDRMTSKERMKSLILNEPIDRVPFVPFFISYLPIDNGISLYDFFTKPDLAFRAGIATADKYPWAHIRPVYGWADHGAWEFGGKIEWPNAEASMGPTTPEPLIFKPEEVDQLPDPEPMETEWFRLRTYFNDLCIQNGYSALLPSGSITAQLGSILGVTNLMIWMGKYPEALHRLAEKVLEFNTKMARMTIENYGAQNCSVMTDLPLESNDLISPKMFEQFSFPYLMRLQGLYFESGVQSIMIHLCGDHKGNLKYWKQVPLPERTIFNIGDTMDLKETDGFLGEKYILAGNISTTILCSGSKEDVKKEVERCLKQAKTRSGGFILMPACEWPPRTPSENFAAIRETLMEYGFY